MRRTALRGPLASHADPPHRAHEEGVAAVAASDPTLSEFSAEWKKYQDQLIQVIEPLTSEQLELRAAPNLRSIRDIATHMVGARGRWLHRFLQLGDASYDEIMTWDRPNMPARTGTELASGLRRTWELLQSALPTWGEAELAQMIEETYHGETESASRRWVIWHLIEHDLHHGGELSFSLGMHGLPAPDL